MKSFLTLTVTALLMTFELICGNMGLSLGLPVFGAFYFAVAFGKNYGLWAAGLSGLLLDAIYARSFMPTAIWMILIVLLAEQCALRLQRHLPVSAILGGALCGFAVFLGNLLHSLICRTAFPGPDIWSMMIFQLIGGIFFMLLMTLLFDGINFRCNLPRFKAVDKPRTFNGGGSRL
ncbi:MAG: hypothetical protein E7050_09820 [Lentisphaerae bacterium]|nr:hypothetical protein [Lentisphaerota bacterium]